MKERLPRYLKKRIKKVCEPNFFEGVFRYIDYYSMTVSQRKWYYLGYINPKHRDYLIKQILEKEKSLQVNKPLGLFDNLSDGIYKGYGIKYLLTLPEGVDYLKEEVINGNLLVTEEIKTILSF